MASSEDFDMETEGYLVEGEDYELTFPPAIQNDQAWNVRILEGDYVETIIRFGNVAVHDEDDTLLNFNFVIQYTPDKSLTEDDEGLQELAGQILLSIMVSAIKNDQLLTTERNDDGSEEDRTGTIDTEESTD